jgi:protein-arginine kinase activator protein McsA
MKCEKCQKAEAVVCYSVISGKFKATRKNYCKDCMASENIKTTPPPAQSVSPQSQEPQSLMNVVQDELAKHKTITRTATKAPDEPQPCGPVKGLRQRMQKAIAEENYEEAARIRDEIAKLTPPKDLPSNKS